MTRINSFASSSKCSLCLCQLNTFSIFFSFFVVQKKYNKKIVSQNDWLTDWTRHTVCLRWVYPFFGSAGGIVCEFLEHSVPFISTLCYLFSFFHFPLSWSAISCFLGCDSVLLFLLLLIYTQVHWKPLNWLIECLVEWQCTHSMSHKSLWLTPELSVLLPLVNKTPYSIL